MFATYAQHKKHRFSDLCIDDTKHAYKFDRSDYLLSGEIPIIDQGEASIAGYQAKKEDMPPYSNLPCLLFGDHTERFKIVHEPFYLGADGTKVILPNDREQIVPLFLFYMLRKEYQPIGHYERHYKYLRDTMLYVPPLTLQNEFADFARDMDKKKAAALRQKEKLVAEREKLVSKYFR